MADVHFTTDRFKKQINVLKDKQNREDYFLCFVDVIFLVVLV